MTMYKHIITSSYADDAGVAQSVALTNQGQNSDGFDGTVPGTTTGFAIPITVAFANIQSMLIYSSVAVTVKTNSTGTPVQTFNLTAGQSIIWGVGAFTTNPITANITQIFVDNNTANPATVKIRFLTT
jgi:hypothetical protein